MCGGFSKAADTEGSKEDFARATTEKEKGNSNSNNNKDR
jgi:hypothetical protein